MTAFALYNYACYNIEMLIKLLTFFIQRLQMFSVIFVTFLRFNDFYFNMNVFFLLICLIDSFVLSRHFWLATKSLLLASLSYGMKLEMHSVERIPLPSPSSPL